MYNLNSKHMSKNEWYWMDKVSGENHHYNEGNEIINQGKSPQQMESSYMGAFVSFLALGILLIGSLIWEWIKNW